MLSDRDILANLNTLDSQFRKANTAQEANFCAKLALLECCGWIEEAMDDIAERFYKRVLKEAKHQVICKEVVKQTYGFEYEKHFRKMIATVIGLTGMEKLESKADPAKLAGLQSALVTLKSVRDMHAHTYLKGAIPTLGAPSFIIGQFHQVKGGLRDIEARLAERAW